GEIKGRNVRLGRSVVFVGIFRRSGNVRFWGARCVGPTTLCRTSLFRTLSGPAMADENDFQPRPGRIRSTRSQRAKPFIAQALSAAQRAGGGVSRQGLLRSGRRSTFGRGRTASVRANHLLTGRSRLVTV